MPPSRFLIVKTSTQPDLYGIFDGETEEFIAWSDCLKGALMVHDDLTNILIEESAVDNAMERLGL